MATGATKTRTRRKTRRKHRSVDDEYESYVIGIEDWKWSFSFGVDSAKHRDGPYMDFRHLHLRGKLLAPSKMASKAETVQAILIPRPIPTDKEYQASEPTSVGSVNLRQKRFDALLTIPDDAIAPVLQMLIAGKFRFIDLHGHRMRYGNAKIRGYRLEMNIDEEDVPASEIVL